jgi:hypothetical protein
VNRPPPPQFDDDVLLAELLPEEDDANNEICLRLCELPHAGHSCALSASEKLTRFSNRVSHS